MVRDDNGLRLEIAAGATANHDPREFSLPIEPAHLEVLRDDLARHLLLWSALVRVCEDAGTSGPLDEAAAVALLDSILLADPAEVDRFLATVRFDLVLLVRHGADVPLLEDGRLVDSLRGATESSDPQRGHAFVANRDRARRGVRLGPLDEAVLRYTGQYLHAATRPQRRPDDVDPTLLPEVLRVVAAAERATAGMRMRRDPRRGRYATRKQDWDAMSSAVEAALSDEHGALVGDATRSIAFLVCSEAAARARSAPVDDGTGVADATAPLSFSDDRGAETMWRPGDPRHAVTAFWEFVAEHAGRSNDVFTLEDEEKGDGIQLHFYAGSAARVTTVEAGRDGADPTYGVEYGLVDDLDGYLALVRGYVAGGFDALGGLVEWLPDAESLERARRRRDEPRHTQGP